jgi:hypothetical protein
MSTDVVDRIESSINIKQGNLPPADFHHPCPARRDTVGFGNPDRLVLSAPPGAHHGPISLRGKRHTKKAGVGPWNLFVYGIEAPCHARPSLRGNARSQPLL